MPAEFILMGMLYICYELNYGYINYPSNTISNRNISISVSTFIAALCFALAIKGLKDSARQKHCCCCVFSPLKLFFLSSKVAVSCLMCLNVLFFLFCRMCTGIGLHSVRMVMMMMIVGDEYKKCIRRSERREK